MFLLPPQFSWVHTGAVKAQHHRAGVTHHLLQTPSEQGAGTGTEAVGTRHHPRVAEWLLQLSLRLLILNSRFSYVYSDRGYIKQQ